MFVVPSKSPALGIKVDCLYFFLFYHTFICTSLVTSNKRFGNCIYPFKYVNYILCTFIEIFPSLPYIKVIHHRKMVIFQCK